MERQHWTNRHGDSSAVGRLSLECAADQHIGDASAESNPRGRLGDRDVLCGCVWRQSDHEEYGPPSHMSTAQIIARRIATEFQFAMGKRLSVAIHTRPRAAFRRTD
jgi:hypothetical protein